MTISLYGSFYHLLPFVNCIPGILDFLNYGTAADKYQEFMKRYPDLVLSVPQQIIASYLKITPQSLRRIRKNIDKMD